MMSLPGNRYQQNTETGSPGLTAERSPKPVHGQPGCFAVCPFPEAGPLRCVGMQSVLPKDPPERPLAPCLKKQKGNTGAPARARSPLPSYPGNPESFPCVCMGVSWGISASCKPLRMWLTSLWAGCVHTPGETRLGVMGKVQAAPAAQEDSTPAGASTSSRVGT